MMKRLLCLILLITLLCRHGFGLGYEGFKPSLGNQINWGDPLTRGLVGCWIFNEGSGNKAGDSSLNGPQGTIYNAIWTPGKFGPCLYFDGTGDYIDTGRNVRTSAPISMSVWMNPANITTVCSIAGMRGVGANTGWCFQFRGDVAGDTLRLTIFGVAGYDSNATGIQANVWYHAVFVYDRQTVTYYLNGKQIGSPAATAAIAVSTYNTYIGAWNDQGVLEANEFTGKLDIPLIYSRALTATEVQQLYMTPFRMFQPSFDMKLYGALAAPPAAVGQAIFITEDED